MNGVHDMGGMHGFGLIQRDDPNQRVWFGAEWEARVCGMQDLLIPRYFNLDAFRYGIERMDPAHYLRAPYFERWLETLATNMIEAGHLTRDEFDERTAVLRENTETPLPRQHLGDPETHPPAPPPKPLVPDLAPRFGVGDAVLTRNVHPTGHTRLPRYARGKRGVVHLVHGTHVFADTYADGRGEHPQVVYNVRFDGRELWGDSAEPSIVVSIDLWESYLEPVQE